MFKLFKRWGSAPTPATLPAPQVARSRPAPPARRPLPPTDALPEVIAEGNEPTDWSLWEDSVKQVDSQMQGLMPTSRSYERDARPSQLDDADAFVGVRNKRKP